MKQAIACAVLLVPMAVQAEQIGSFYLGVTGGAGKFNGKPDYDALTLDLGDSGKVAGGYLGYSATNGRLKFSFELDYLKYSGELEGKINALDIGVGNKFDHSYSGSILMGMMAAPDIELYARAGYGKLKVKTTSGTLASPVERDEKLDSTHAGLGIRFTNHTQMGFRVEYRHMMIEDYKMSDGKNFESNGDVLLAGFDYSF
ncbi:hypothetical protein EOPP23_09595 [Endozoicomonas sp. OPT23]|uniref:outer membrane beta-barrel protein n=1 Tax=Endozoicomonas sp. OPT23 TaxID=2072845 RepID=UPI00129BF170|nr:outer membrane beta-barrel protein [Endozoicomonas sp. OPT23]MRI33234.1 hypothetical protein [Endozoicomonas sp. OPT23]